jgi:hypothetical protein
MADTTKTVAITTGANDGHFTSSNVITANINLVISSIATVFANFSISIPKSSIIKSAYLTFTPYNASTSGTVNIIADKSGAPNPITSQSDYGSRVKTTSQVSWVINASGNTPINTPDISSVIQEVTDSYDITKMQLYLLSVAGTVQFSSYNHSQSYAPKLSVTYSLGESFTPAIITVVANSMSKISDEPGKTTCTVTFKPDQALTAWEARADGTGQGQGLLVGSGGAVTANTEVTFDVDYTELTQGDKTYRINIYGQNASGAWTVYG